MLYPESLKMKSLNGLLNHTALQAPARAKYQFILEYSHQFKILDEVQQRLI